jgi:hypothetical protein
VLILQVSGAKTWRLYDSSIPLPAAFQIQGKAGHSISQEDLDARFVGEGLSLLIFDPILFRNFNFFPRVRVFFLIMF